MDFSPFDTRHYPTVPVEAGYSAWAETYEDTVLDLMDRRLLDRLTAIDWARVGAAADLACGTGRTGAWLRGKGIPTIDGVDLTRAMLERARARRIYRDLVRGDVTASGFTGGAYGVVTLCLADEHLADLAPLYREAARLCAADGSFVLVGYHPHFLMKGIVTHFNAADGAPLAIESHVHLMSDHVAAAHGAGFVLAEMTEGLVDDDWIAAKPKWHVHRSHPVSFAMVWRKPAGG